MDWEKLSHLFPTIEEDESIFIERILKNKILKIRIATKASNEMKIKLSKNMCYINDLPVLANGRFELLNYLRETSISKEYHRYGNLGARENEFRKPTI